MEQQRSVVGLAGVTSKVNRSVETLRQLVEPAIVHGSTTNLAVCLDRPGVVPCNVAGGGRAEDGPPSDYATHGASSREGGRRFVTFVPEIHGRQLTCAEELQCHVAEVQRGEYKPKSIL